MSNFIEDNAQAGPAKLIPGSNPNKDNAKRRMNNRPKARNTPRSAPSTDDTTRWIDPLPVVDPAPAEFQNNIDSVPSGYVDLDFDLPTTIITPFLSVIATVLHRTVLDDALITHVQENMAALAYFKAARQLYSTLTDVEKTKLQPLKGVFYDTSPIPVRASSGMSIIGHFDTKFGTIEVRDAPLLFKRWIAKGIHLSSEETDGRFGNAHRLIWFDHASKDHIDRVATTMLKNIADTTYVVHVNEQDVTVRSPIPAATIAGFNSISDLHPRAGDMRLLVALLLMPTAEYVNRRLVLYNGLGLDNALHVLGYEVPHVATDDAHLRDIFSDIIMSYTVTDLPQIRSIFNTADGPTTGTGYAAQIVSSEANNMQMKLPISDSDKYYGYMFNPNVGFDFHPSFKAFGRKRPQDYSYEFAARDGKPIVN